ncbi:DUF503 domain-containing protein [Candidatus Formimonas warabiya]|uniref:DUF503 domain-containing protein n=1 Tax=Formimonas warabiya TaxID=1761012 RepID=A0A3G1KMH2_FORW1|nr:DUF503 domain-containing protein [Candidatus Formimonas warabiya]ATW23676.1 hypothetical protein DCMF_01700 [Candidatus Formimonas warabiya]
MVVGTCTFEMHLNTSQSLKDKRRVLKSVIERVKNKFNVSIAEVDRQDNWQIAVIGIAVVSNNSVHVNQVLNNVAHFIEDASDEIEVIHVLMEII